MKRGGGRAKGSRFERQVAKMIVKAFASKGITEKDCFRTPLSGGHRWASKSDPGDLVISPKLRRYFPFTVECKSYKKIKWHELMSTPIKGEVAKWWAQAVKAAKVQDGCPLLVFKSNGTQAYAMCYARQLSISGTPRLETSDSYDSRLVVVPFVRVLWEGQ